MDKTCFNWLNYDLIIYYYLILYFISLLCHQSSSTTSRKYHKRLPELRSKGAARVNTQNNGRSVPVNQTHTHPIQLITFRAAGPKCRWFESQEDQGSETQSLLVSQFEFVESSELGRFCLSVCVKRAQTFAINSIKATEM